MGGVVVIGIGNLILCDALINELANASLAASIYSVFGVWFIFVVGH
jgi:hypothetical protein